MDETEKSLNINGDEKMLLDEINFIRQNIKLSEAEVNYGHTGCDFKYYYI